MEGNGVAHVGRESEAQHRDAVAEVELREVINCGEALKSSDRRPRRGTERHSLNWILLFWSIILINLQK